MGIDEGQDFTNLGLSRDHYASTGPIRSVFKQAFKANGLPPTNPHVFRDTITQLGERLCNSPEHLKAWSQNMGHEQVLTTLTSYGKVDPQRQAKLILDLGHERGAPSKSGAPDAATIDAVLQHLKDKHQKDGR